MHIVLSSMLFAVPWQNGLMWSLHSFAQLHKRPFSHPRVEIRSPNKEGCQGSWISPSMTNIIVCFPSPKKAFRNCFVQHLSCPAFFYKQAALNFRLFLLLLSPMRAHFMGVMPKGCCWLVWLAYLWAIAIASPQTSSKDLRRCSHLTSYSLDFRWWFGAVLEKL